MAQIKTISGRDCMLNYWTLGPWEVVLWYLYAGRKCRGFERLGN